MRWEFLGFPGIIHPGAKRAGARFALEEKQHVAHVVSKLACFDLRFPRLPQLLFGGVDAALNVIAVVCSRDPRGAGSENNSAPAGTVRYVLPVGDVQITTPSGSCSSRHPAMPPRNVFSRSVMFSAQTLEIGRKSVSYPHRWGIKLTGSTPPASSARRHLVRASA